MKTRSFPVILFIFYTLGLQAQEVFHSRLLVSSPYREGFPTFSPDGNFMVFQRCGRTPQMVPGWLARCF